MKLGVRGWLSLPGNPGFGHTWSAVLGKWWQLQVRPLKCETFLGVREQEWIFQGKMGMCSLTLKASAAGKWERTWFTCMGPLVYMKLPFWWLGSLIWGKTGRPEAATSEICHQGVKQGQTSWWSGPVSIGIRLSPSACTNVLLNASLKTNLFFKHSYLLSLFFFIIIVLSWGHHF